MVRLKTRYLLCEVLFEDGKVQDGATAYMLLNALKDSIEANFGDVGLGAVAASIQVKYFNPLTGMAIVRASRDLAPMVWAAATLVTALRKRTCLVRVVHVSGTIRLLQRRAIEFNRDAVRLLRAHKVLAAAECETMAAAEEAQIAKLDA
ncbi:RNA-binding protein pop5 [Polyrhizophydium stewartii]|uniref:Ribonuclease P/MRP protein subunit POP5 n=1 Tax=Polyrhizophydium stewartii TaxID=2732419 RepID=A0ABR4NC40_9FUNG